MAFRQLRNDEPTWVAKFAIQRFGRIARMHNDQDAPDLDIYRRHLF
jgi:hypothetical protein